MNNVSIISYPAHRDSSLLSLTDMRSKYMLPFAARYRVADFTLRNAHACYAKKTMIFSNTFDDLSNYVQHHPLSRNDEQVSTKVYNETKLSAAQCSRLLFTKPTAWYIIYNGDSPALIDFNKLIQAAKDKKKSGPVMYMIDYNGRPTMSHVILLCDKKTLESFFKKAVKDKNHSHHIFEMIMNHFILKNIRRESVKAYYRPLLHIPEYYHSNFETVRDTGISEMIFKDPHLRSGMNVLDHVYIAPTANVSSSVISEGCRIYGSVSNSIIFPGTTVGEKDTIRDSIILPYGKIASNTRIERTIVDEFTDRNRTDNPFNIGPDSFIGDTTQGYKNAEFPKSIFDSITLIGKNCMLPAGLRTGAACYIASGTGLSSFEKTKTLEDGISIADTSSEHANDPE